MISARRLVPVIGFAKLALSLAAIPVAVAQSFPMLSADDPRIAVLHYAPGIPTQLHAIAGTDLSLLMPKGEHVLRVVVGDPGAVRVDVPGEHDGLVIAALHPVTEVGLIVETDQQTYSFALSVTYQGSVPWMVRLVKGGMSGHSQFPAAPISAPPPGPPARPGTWAIKGDKALLPSAIHDDGAKISIQWTSAQAIPAVFALDERGQEQIVNGYMRGDEFVIDRVFEHLVFRIDKAVVHADRSEARSKP